MSQALFKLILVICALNLCLTFHQENYNILHDKIIIEYYNRSAVRDPIVAVEDFNSTCKRGKFHASGVFITGVKKNILISGALYKMVGNTYRSLNVPETSIDLCKEIKNQRKELLGPLSYANLHGCPAPPGKYYIKDYVLEEEKFPPHAPLGKYKIFLQVYLDDVIMIGNGTWQGSIVKRKKS